MHFIIAMLAVIAFVLFIGSCWLAPLSFRMWSSRRRERDPHSSPRKFDDSDPDPRFR